MGNPVILPRADSCDVPPQKKPRIQFDTSGQEKIMNISVLGRCVYYAGIIIKLLMIIISRDNLFLTDDVTELADTIVDVCSI